MKPLTDHLDGETVDEGVGPFVHGDERPSNIGELVEKAEAEAAEQARADLVADRDALRAALSRIAGWSAHYKDEAKTSIRLSLRLIHDEAMRAHPNALTGSVSEPRPDTLDDIDEAWHRDRPSQPLCNHALARRGSVSEPPRPTPEPHNWRDHSSSPHHHEGDAIAADLDWDRFAPRPSPSGSIDVERLARALQTVVPDMGTFARGIAVNVAAEYERLRDG